MVRPKRVEVGGGQRDAQIDAARHARAAQAAQRKATVASAVGAAPQLEEVRGRLAGRARAAGDEQLAHEHQAVRGEAQACE